MHHYDAKYGGTLSPLSLSLSLLLSPYLSLSLLSLSLFPYSRPNP